MNTKERKKAALSKLRALLGSKGGKAPTTRPKGFAAMTKAKHMAASRKGGSRPGPKGVTR